MSAKLMVQWYIDCRLIDDCLLLIWKNVKKCFTYSKNSDTIKSKTAANVETSTFSSSMKGEETKCNNMKAQKKQWELETQH